MIEAFPLYEISTYGRLRKIKTNRILNCECKKHRYIRVNLNNGKKLQTVAIHRLVAMAFIPNPENKSDVNHMDRNTRNNNLQNLQWCTKSENVQHMYKTGYTKDVKIKWKAILLRDEDKNVVKRFERSLDVQNEYGLSQSGVSQLVRGIMKNKWVKTNKKGLVYLDLSYEELPVNEDEEWRNVIEKDDDVEHIYEVSNLGRIRNKVTANLIHGKTDGRYMRVGLTYKAHAIHRLVAFAFLARVPGSIIVNHKNGDTLDNKVSNIEWCTQKENMAHARDVLNALENRVKPGRYYCQLYLNGTLARKWFRISDIKEHFKDSAGCLSSICSNFHNKNEDGRTTYQGYGWCWEENLPTEDVQPKWNDDILKMYPEVASCENITAGELEIMSAIVKACSKPVFKYTCDGRFITRYASHVNAADELREENPELGPSVQFTISKSARDVSFCYGFCWKFASLDEAIGRKAPCARILPLPLVRVFGDIDIDRPLDIELIEYLMEREASTVRPVWQLSLDGVRIKKWPGVTAAMDGLNMGRMTIDAVLSGHSHVSNGYMFENATVYDEMGDAYLQVPYVQRTFLNGKERPIVQYNEEGVAMRVWKNRRDIKKEIGCVFNASYPSSFRYALDGFAI